MVWIGACVSVPCLGAGTVDHEEQKKREKWHKEFHVPKEQPPVGITLLHCLRCEILMHVGEKADRSRCWATVNAAVLVHLDKFMFD